MRFKAVIFDYDQTVVDSLAAFYECFNMALTLNGLKALGWDEFAILYARDELDSVIEGRVGIKDFWELFLRLYEVVRAEPRVYPSALPVLSWLKRQGVGTALITGRKCSEKVLAQELLTLGLLQYFDVVMTGLTVEDESFLFSKRRAIREALALLSSQPSEAVLVCDYKTDIISGKMEGLYVVAVTTGHMSRDELAEQGADAVIEDLRELPEVLERA